MLITRWTLVSCNNMDTIRVNGDITCLSPTKTDHISYVLFKRKVSL